MSASIIDHTDHDTTTKVTPNTVTSRAVTTAHDLITIFGPVVMTSQPAHAKTPDSTGLIQVHSLSGTNYTCMSASTDHTDHNSTTKVTPDTFTSPAITTAHDLITTFGPVVMTSQPAHAKTPDSTGLIAAVTSVITALLGTVIVLVVIVLLVKKRYSNVMREKQRILFSYTLQKTAKTKTTCVWNGQQCAKRETKTNS